MSAVSRAVVAYTPISVGTLIISLLRGAPVTGMPVHVNHFTRVAGRCAHAVIACWARFPARVARVLEWCGVEGIRSPGAMIARASAAERL